MATGWRAALPALWLHVLSTQHFLAWVTPSSKAVHKLVDVYLEAAKPAVYGAKSVVITGKWLPRGRIDVRVRLLAQ